jgi:putative transcriptional regulator
MKRDLLENVSIFLLKKGFTIKNLSRACFDILARNNERILLIKILEDANSIGRGYSDEMNRIASYIGATPLIVSEKAGHELDDNVVYTRFGLFTLTFKTFANCINNKLPFVKRTQAGLTASLDGKKLRHAREELGYSLNSLSKKIGVTTKMVIKYENENSEVTLNRAMKIYDIFGESVFNKIDLFTKNERVEEDGLSELSRKYLELGFHAADTNKVPFDIIAKKENELILTEVGDKIDPNAASLSRLLDADNLVIFKKKKPKDIPAVTKKEFLEFEKANQLIKFVKGF